MKAGYKQTEVGVIPEEWVVKSLGQMTELTSSKRIFESDYVPFGIPFYRGKEISMLVEGEVIDDVCYISEARFAAIRAKFGAPVRGDILITAVGVAVSGYFLQRMKTKWGSCNHRAGNIRLNTELVKKPKDLLEYVVVHEIVHLIEPKHSERFIALMTKNYPTWREARAELNELPLTAEIWQE